MNSGELNEIQKTESEIYELTKKLNGLRRDNPPIEVKDYIFDGIEGKVNLSDLFGEHSQLIAIHNMGQGCRYCTLWGDGINSFLPHLENQFAVVMLSKDSPSTQRLFANDRGWRFHMVSHGGSEYMTEQSVVPSGGNMPGMVVYEKKDGKIYKKNSSVFGPGDMFCSFWHMISLAGRDESNMTPQFGYWKRPSKMDDGGENII